MQNYSVKSVPFLVLCISGLILYQVLGQEQDEDSTFQNSKSSEASTKGLMAHMMTVQKNAYDGKISFEKAQQQIDDWAAQHEGDFRALPLAGSIVQADSASLQEPGTSSDPGEAALAKAMQTSLR